MANILIYKLNKKKFQKDLEKPIFEVKVWRPSFIQWIPPRYPQKYVIYWFFHYFRFFQNRAYNATLFYDRGKVVAALMIVPTYLKWKFMKKGDVQLTYVLTEAEYRGKGIGKKLVNTAIQKIFSENSQRDIWYVTDEKNIASIKLCTRVGFELQGIGHKRNGLLTTQLELIQ
jgi:RimJ/RimL family protein N-acetyltransferase